MLGLFTPEVLVALGVSASAGLATVLGSLFVLRTTKRTRIISRWPWPSRMVR
jgi:hypothetical protein